MARPLVQARVNESLDTRIEEYVESTSTMSKSDAIRELLKKGLDEDRGGASDTELIQPAATALLALSIATFALDARWATISVAAVSFVMFAVAIGLEYRQ